MRYHTQILWLIIIIQPLSVASEELPIDSTIKDKNKEKSALDRRIQNEQATHHEPYVLTPHNPNYILPFTYNETPTTAPIYTSKPDAVIDEKEVKFQISIKYPMVENFFHEKSTLYFAYTNTSFWQAYNDTVSNSFRETIHEPEVFVLLHSHGEFIGLKKRIIMFGVSHQSNGRSDDYSRNWNRMFVNFIFEKENYYLSVKPWYRIANIGIDENPDILKYYGYGEIRGVYVNNKHTLSIMLRNNLHSQNYGAFEFNWSFPIGRRTKWLIQYFNGYGESLVDYNSSVNRLGIGIAFTDWL